ncbi:hypothetical protein SAMN05443573_108148 [Celeribacter indicus]|uniref:Uncharacterized protein n=1 Tax=Celeribacter indicus TaxID=1208324 RepID=A0A0B5DPJ5_9RHOB|nr:hypothetical protein P73_0788 [Celeribacter indicus]SDW87367.1 hypothetical protein SAMN05443573_108148 [Celeribacter indicus]
MREMQTSALGDLFPPAPEGWQAAEDADAGVSMMGSGTADARRYFNDAARNSPSPMSWTGR